MIQPHAPFAQRRPGRRRIATPYGLLAIALFLLNALGPSFHLAWGHEHCSGHEHAADHGHGESTLHADCSACSALAHAQGATLATAPRLFQSAYAPPLPCQNPQDPIRLSPQDYSVGGARAPPR